MLSNRESLENAARQALHDAELPDDVPAAEVFKFGFYAGVKAAKLEEQEALLKSLTLKR